MLAFGTHGGAIAQTPPTFPIRINVGSDQPYTDHRGRVYLPDQEWTEQTQAGHVGGYQVYGRFPVGGTPDRLMYENQRRNWQEYRFSGIPNSGYLVTLHFSEIAVLDEHNPSYTTFDVTIEDETVLDELNLFAEVGGNYALVRRFPVTVTDGELNVTSTPVFGESRLAAIEVAERSPDILAPAIPTNLTATDSYNAILLDWADNLEDDLDGYYVYRAASPDSTYTRLTVEPTYVSRYQDIVTTTHFTYYYRVSAVDVYGNESDLTSYQSAAALDEHAAAHPYYQLELSPESLHSLITNPWSNNEVIGNFIYEGQPFPVEVRYRGNWGRYHYKKSWKIRFIDRSPFPGQSEINLRADYMDRSLMHSKLATDLFEAAGIRPSQAKYVLLQLNGEYVGVYIQAEQVDEGFLERTGRNPSVSIYKTVETDLMDFSRQQPSEQAYYRAFDKKANRDSGYGDVIAFIELINNTPDETFAYELRHVFDVAGYLDYYAIIILTSNPDFSSHNVYLLHDWTIDRWEAVPYDLDLAFYPWDDWLEMPGDSPIDRGTPESPIWNWVTNLLLTRVLNVPQFRAYYCHRLAEFMDTIFSDAVMHSLIDATYAAIEPDVLRDWRKLGWENDEWFETARDDLKTYVTERKDFLWGKIPEYCPADQPYLSINEVMTDNRTALEDPDEPGEFPAWFEVYNKGLEAVNLSGMYLTDDLADPTKFQITDGITIPAGGFITFFADGEPDQGLLHTSFRLDRARGQIGIFSGAQQAQQIDVIDVYTYTLGSQMADVSQGRYPDGVDRWTSFSRPTAGSSNLLLPPVISTVAHTPLLPAALDAVTVTAIITDDGTLLTTTLQYSGTGSGFVVVPMDDLQRNLYVAQIPPQPDGTLVQYRVLAGDDDRRIGADPSGGFHGYIVGYQPPALFINELMADNETMLGDADEPGEFPDWIELYNPGPDTVDLGGRYLSDDLNNPIKFRIADGTTIPAGGFLVFYADDDPEQGPRHTNFRLIRNGGSIGLFDIDVAGNQLIDAYAFGPQPTDGSGGRCPDGIGTWISFPIPTPGITNQPCGILPTISNASHTPLFPSATDEVTVTAIVTDDGAVVTATLWYSAGAGFVATPMTHMGGNAYVAAVPARADGTGISYYIQAEDDRGLTAADPLRAPADTHYYLPGYQPPPLFINEFMADNAMTLEDPDEPGEFPDWIELYNPGPHPIDLGGMYLTDDLTDPTKFRIPDGLTISAGGFALFYADNAPEQGPFHTNFKLNRIGGSIGLFDDDAIGNQPIDVHTFSWQTVDVSERRYPNGGDSWITFRTPTPGIADIVTIYLPPTLKQTMH